MPKEGATGWSDTWMIAANAKHPNCMYKWMNYIVSPTGERAGRRVLRRGAGADPGVQVHVRQELLRHLPRPRRGLRGKIHYWTTPQTQCVDGSGNDCTDYSEWVTKWQEIKG